MACPGYLFGRWVESKDLGRVQISLQVNSSHLQQNMTLVIISSWTKLFWKYFQTFCMYDIFKIHMYDIFNIPHFPSFTLPTPITFFSALFFWFKVNSYWQKLYTIKCKYWCYTWSLVIFFKSNLLINVFIRQVI